ncbi:MAG: glucoamylase family protein [Coriobacteriia bacterium]|nr:glucoamylase family protein [Coriobacteriia bacterium]
MHGEAESATEIPRVVAQEDFPLRAELLSTERLADEARGVAATQRWTTADKPRTTPLIALMANAARSLASDNSELNLAVRQGLAAPPAGEWLLDNYYLIEEQVLLVHEDLPARYGVELPRLASGEHAEMPRIYDALLTLIAHTDSRLDEDRLLAFVDGYQDVAPLSIGEVWAVPIVLRIGIVENLRRLSRAVVLSEREERDADAWAERLLLTGQDDPSQLPALLAELDVASSGRTAPFYVRLSHRLSDLAPGAGTVNTWLEHRLLSEGISLDEAATEAQQLQAANQVSIANAITAIRFLDAYGWREFFERVSLVEATLRHDPSHTYSAMGFESRDRYRHALEAMAHRCDRTEIELAEEVVSLCRGALVADPADEVRGHVGWWLIAGGRPELERRVGYRQRKREMLYRGPLRNRGLFYGGTLLVMEAVLLAVTALLAFGAGAELWQATVVVLLAVIPLSEVAVALMNRLASLVFPARLLPKLDHREPVGEDARTLVIVPALLSSPAAARSVIANLEVAYLANRDENVAFGVLGDLKGASEATTPGDHAVIEAAVQGVSELNERYGAEHGVRPFHLLVRARSFNEPEGTWMGWERKRGALVELVREMRGDPKTSFCVRLGDADFRRSCVYAITLDADTLLPRDDARKLIGTIAHPLNRARLEHGERRVRRGYGLVQPRVSMTISGAARSRYAALNSGVPGLDPYANAISDTYQDVFGEGSFTGKGIFEIDVFHGLLEGLFPDNTLLSHDLVEGSFVRTALASDVEVLDEYPPNYLAAASRLHRWIRGDWQTLPFLAPRLRVADGSVIDNPLSGLHKWKILDNLRRSVVPFATLLLVIVGWGLVPEAALWWPLAGLLAVLFPALFSFVDAVVTRPRTLPLSASLPGVARDLRSNTVRQLFAFSTLPHQAYLATDAAVRSVWRLFVSHQHLLEWETAADAQARAGTTPRAFVRTMAPAAVIVCLGIVAVAALVPTRFLTALPVALLWLASPFAAWWLSQDTPPAAPDALSERETLALRRIARKTWRFFDAFVVADGHHLAPDNFQESPGGVVAWRTSPTNMGLQLITYLGAYDLGYLTLNGMVERVAAVLASMAGLDRFRGHFYNWYDIRTLEPLHPAYVSTVDSGNLAGHLLVLRVGLLEASEAPLVGPQVLSGARDAVRLALEDFVAAQDRLGPESASHGCREALDALERALSLTEPPADLGGWSALLVRLTALADEAVACAAALSEPGPDAFPGPHETSELAADSPPVPSTPLQRLRASVADASRAVHRPLELVLELAPWARRLSEVPGTVRSDADLQPLLVHVPSLTGLAEGLGAVLAALDEHAAGEDRAVAAWSSAVAAGIREVRPTAVQLLARLRLSSDIAREMWEHTDFGMLYDPHRQLFSIGYNLSEGRLDGSYYDLVASECRLASFLAIAKGDVPQEHWFRLGRSLTKTAQGRALVSWSASMFEYLMPLLVMRDWPGTLLSETYRVVVDRQIAYGSDRGVPWGVSESAFNAKDVNLTYQYQAFGVPGLGLKRGLSDDIVIAPYASVLALPVAPAAVTANLAAIREAGGEGAYGLYEALDYTPGRVPAGQTRAVVRAYFAHHQGMSFVALTNTLAGACMQTRFHGDPLVVSAELLLQERVPRNALVVEPHVEEVREVRSVRELPPPVTRTYPAAPTAVPATHFLSNGRYSVMVTNAGGGYSRCNDLAINRYREDVTRDCWGTFFYVRDAESGHVFSAPRNPVPTAPDFYHVTFAPDKAEYHRTDGDLETHIEVAVSPEDDVEVRRLAITNRGRTPRSLEITSYFEIAFAAQGADQAHKSFSNLFVETEALPSTHALLFTRRPRSSTEERLWGLHLVACDTGACEWSFETDRAAFLGRLRAQDSPAAVFEGGPLSGSAGAVLDPCCALRQSVKVPPGETVRLVFATGVASTREAAVRLTEKYHDTHTCQRAIDLAWTASQLELRDLGISPREAVTLERLASRLLLTDPYSKLKIKTPCENGLRIDGLWSIGISGDNPILLVRVEELEHAPLVRQALLAHQYWRHKGLVADLVVLNTRPTGYADELDDRLRLLVRTGHALQMLDKPGGVFLRRCDQMHPDVLNLLLSVARATLDGDAGTIELQLNRRGTYPEMPDSFIRSRDPEEHPASALERPILTHDNGIGGFDPKTGEYVIVLEGEQTTPAPWINVLANPTFGATVSEAGAGCTWALNSHENRITTWNNDPVTDGSGESLYIRDEETGEFWSPTPLPVRTPGPYVIRHGQGATRFEHTTQGIRHELDWFVSADDPVRVCRLTLTNEGVRRRHLSVTQLVEWVLGDSRSKAQQLVVTWFDAEADILTAHNHFNFDFPGRCAFLACDRELHSWTASRSEFIGRNGRASDPAALHRTHLGGTSGRYHDNCGALMTRVALEPGESAEVSFLLGQTNTLEECRELVARLRRSGAVTSELARARSFWSELLGTVEVDTPDDRLDLLVNGRLLYQVTACRLWGRTATYQSSGAFGFRDQLQDVMALLLVRPDLVRTQILEASRHQFPEGDVQHWWQPYSGRGVRTRISDDRHWLPLVVAEYLDATGDYGVLDEKTAFLDAQLLAPDAEDAYQQPAVSEQAVSVYEHCIRALEAGRPTGAHGLPLMGGGDWNDGMNRVGHEGRGESVWLAWFLGHVLMRFAPVCEHRGEIGRATEYQQWATTLAASVEETSWDGAWYRRAYFDDGTPLGSRDSEECRIDAIAQAWATISGLGDPERSATALDSVEEKLVRREDGLIALLTPPFDRMAHDPGYIKGYVPGVRENGGQYTHAAVWVALAHLLRGDGDEGAALLDLINPIRHASDAAGVERYKVEPYVIAADVYAVAPHTGRGGWTWYTGSASWFYRVALNTLLGFRVRSIEGSPHLSVDPCIPKHWPRYTMAYRFGSTTYAITVENPRGVNRGVAHVSLDGVRSDALTVPLTDDGRRHEVLVTLLGG